MDFTTSHVNDEPRYLKMPTADEIIRGIPLDVVPGQPCPACGRKVPMSGAERQRRWRAKRKAKRDYALLGKVLQETD